MEQSSSHHRHPILPAVCASLTLAWLAASCATSQVCPECNDPDAGLPIDAPRALCQDPTEPDRCGVEPTAYCTDLTADPQNCGFCGASCGVEQTCVASQCECPIDRPAACGVGGDATCVDLLSDPQNCGGCGLTCPDGWTCESLAGVGQCTDPCDAVPLPAAETFTFIGDQQMYIVPACVTIVQIQAYGAQGQGGFGGNGGMAQAELTVGEGEILHVMVGGADGYNGGGAGNAAIANNGGGASDVRVGSTELTDRVLVAGGGGGGSMGDVASRPGGAGGGGVCGAYYCGGGGGVGYGGDGGVGDLAGGSGNVSTHSGGAGGGGAESGGQGSCQTYNAPMTCGGDGALGQGGAGGPYVQPECYDTYGGTAGGGGGYYGGGGSGVGYCGGGGAGGGSSWTGTLANSTFGAGVQAGDGMVVITPIE